MFLQLFIPTVFIVRQNKSDSICIKFGIMMMQVLVELPYIFGQSIIYGLIVYSTLGFQWTAAKFMWFFFYMFFTFLYYTYYGMMTVALTPNAPFAAIVSSAFYGVWMLFAGFLIPRTVSSKVYRFTYFLNDSTHAITNKLVFAEHSCVVEMVLLGMPRCLDNLWSSDFPVWRYDNKHVNIRRRSSPFKGLSEYFIWF